MVKKTPKFGTAAWQNMMAIEVAKKHMKGEKLNDFEKAFVEVQVERLPIHERKWIKKKLKKVI
jgi:hypothetical protein